METENFQLISLKDFFQNKASGPMNVERAEAILKTIVKLEKGNPNTPIMIDGRKAERAYNYKDLLKFADAVVRSGLAKDTPIAILNPKEINYLKFFESRLHDLGFHKLKVFDSFEFALEWLNPEMDE